MWYGRFLLVPIRRHRKDETGPCVRLAARDREIERPAVEGMQADRFLVRATDAGGQVWRTKNRDSPR